MPKNQPRERRAAWEPGATVPAPEEWPDPSSPPTLYLTGRRGNFSSLLSPSAAQADLGFDVVEITALKLICGLGSFTP